MKRTRSGTVYDATEDDDGTDEVVQSGGDYDDEDDDEEDIRAAAEKPKTFTARVKELLVVREMRVLTRGGPAALPLSLEASRSADRRRVLE